MHHLPRFFNVSDSIATLITDVSPFVPLSVGGKSLDEEAFVRIKVMIISSKLTTQNFAYFYVRPPEKIHHHVGFKGFQRLLT